jgi:hypothetical protein
MNLDTTNVLPRDLLIPESGSHLYRIGLSLFKYGDKPRFRFCTPVIVWLTMLSLYIKQTLSLFTDKNNPHIFLMIGDFPYFLNIKIHYYLLSIILNLLLIISLIYNLYYYMNGIKPSYMKPFDMMSGLVSPQSIGLYYPEDVKKLLKITKLLFYFYYRITRFVYPWFLLAFIPLSINCSTIMDLIVFAIPWSLYHTLCGYFVANLYFYQLIYFQIICYYLKLKLKSINKELVIPSKNKTLNKFSFKMIILNLNKLNSIYCEIHEYNNNYWSIFLFWLILILVTSIIIFLFIILFMTCSSLIVSVIFIYGEVFMLIILIYFLNCSSQVYYETNKSYKYLNAIILNNANILDLYKV